MKHPIWTTLTLVLLFIAAQVVGLALLSLNIDEIVTQGDAVIVEHGTTALGERPDTQGWESVLMLVIGVTLGTVVMLILIRYKILHVWKAWFLLAVWFSTAIAFGVMLPTAIALGLALVLAIWKVYFPNPFVHNFTEVFMYAGLAVLLVPLFSIAGGFVILAIISVYDAIAVWQSKHMVTMAKAQTESQLFAGLMIPKKTSSRHEARHSPMVTTTGLSPSHRAASRAPASTHSMQRAQPSAAILGGGDIAFPLLYTGIVMDWLIRQGLPRSTALYQSLIVTAFAAAALTLLFCFAKKDRFYPAMPFLSAGCVAGFFIIWLIHL
jgi:presenilin-like A22 family membrane protease